MCALQANQPFARHEHDVEHEDMLRGKSRFGDPFAHLTSRKTPAAEAAAATALTERYNVDALEKSGVWGGPGRAGPGGGRAVQRRHA